MRLLYDPKNVIPKKIVANICLASWCYFAELITGEKRVNRMLCHGKVLRSVAYIGKRWQFCNEDRCNWLSVLNNQLSLSNHLQERGVCLFHSSPRVRT